MSRRSRKYQDTEGDRSHIPREERSYVEYHPALLTHLALTLVRQAATQQKSTHSQGPSISYTNGRGSISSASDLAKELRPSSNTPTASIASNDLQDTRRDDMYAFGQITNNVDHAAAILYEETAGNLFEIDPAQANVQADDVAPQLSASTAMEPPLPNGLDSYLAITEPVLAPAPTNGLELEPATEANGNHEHVVIAGARPNQSRGSNARTSDRFLRSEVSVEEKYERLRREEGFSIGKLHEPRFRTLNTSVAEHKVKLTGNAIAFGYQADRPFKRPEQAYIRTIDILESELADRVEYDMDEQDDYWLTSYNERRKLRDGDTISREIFEIILTKIEKEWTSLEKMIPRVEKKDDAASEDAKCAICDDGECENTNAIVFCDGCNLAVHQECYGVPYIPEGQWLCRKCFASPMDPVSCLFCPSNQGAFKQTSDLHWAHLLCTNWIPEVSVGNPVFMEPIEGVNNIPASRWKLTCYICKLKVGACIQCSNKSCYTSFHVSCARRARLFLQQNPDNLISGGKSFCDRHVPDWYREENDVDSAFADAQNYFAVHTDMRTQTLVGGDIHARGKFVVSLKRSKQSAVIPAIVFSKILLYMQKFRIRNKADFIGDLCKYWSLKRRSRRGLSLLKRLQVQIEDNVAQKMDDKQKDMKIEFGKRLLDDLDNYQRPLVEDLLEREIIKNEKCEMRDSVIDQIVLPLQPVFKEAIAAIDDADNNAVLSSTLLPTELVQNAPAKLTWPIFVQNVQDAQYLSTAMFETDLTCVLEGILEAHMEPTTRENKSTRRLQERLAPILMECRNGERALALHPASMMATCFDDDYEPEGLSLLEEKPFNWANRDASPLSDLDDDAIEELAREFALPKQPKDKLFASTSKAPRADTPRQSVPHVEMLPATPGITTKACTGCKKRKVRCDGRGSICQKRLAHLAGRSPITKSGTRDSHSPLMTGVRSNRSLRKTPDQPQKRDRASRSTVVEVRSAAAMPNSGTSRERSGINQEFTPSRLSRSVARDLTTQALKRKIEEEEIYQRQESERPNKKGRRR